MLSYSLLWGFLRRWFGGGFEDINNKDWLDSRGLQNTVMILSMFFLWFNYEWYDWQGYILPLLTAIYIQVQFWMRGHGCCFDMGMGREPTPEDIERYNERWYHKVCDKLFPDDKYTSKYDFWYMLLRYTCPMILPSILYLQWSFLLAGLVVAPIYALCWKYIGYSNKVSATGVAEIISGFLFGLLIFNTNLEVLW